VVGQSPEYVEVNGQTQLDWRAIRERAALFPEEAFQFVREGLAYTAKLCHGEPLRPNADQADDRRHVSGQQLCMGLKKLATERYGLLARAVFCKWGIRATDDFGVIVYALIDRSELRQGERDSFEDFKNVFDFEEAFGESTRRA
jgi:uncharacterized repeat protein (TIGR04138 family)